MASTTGVCAAQPASRASALAAARYLCSGGMNLRDQTHVMAAILRYNNSVAYARNVLGWAAAYATGVSKPFLDYQGAFKRTGSNMEWVLRARFSGIEQLRSAGAVE